MRSVLFDALHGAAFGKSRAAPELLPRFRAGFRRANHQCAAAFRALPFGGRVVSTLEVLHVLALGRYCWRATAGLQSLQHGVDLKLRKYWLPKGFDIADKTDALGNVVWLSGLEGAAADEGDH